MSNTHDQDFTFGNVGKPATDLTVTIQGGGTTTPPVHINPPTTAGTANQVLATDGNTPVNASWLTESGVIGGSNTQVQFNDNGSLGAITGTNWDKSDGTFEWDFTYPVSLPNRSPMAVVFNYAGTDNSNEGALEVDATVTGGSAGIFSGLIATSTASNVAAGGLIGVNASATASAGPSTPIAVQGVADSAADGDFVWSLNAESKGSANLADVAAVAGVVTLSDNTKTTTLSRVFLARSPSTAQNVTTHYGVDIEAQNKPSIATSAGIHIADQGANNYAVLVDGGKSKFLGATTIVLPTSDPNVANAIWINAGNIAISAG